MNGVVTFSKVDATVVRRLALAWLRRQLALVVGAQEAATANRTKDLSFYIVF